MTDRPFFVDDGAVDRLSFNDGQWIDIKHRMSYADIDRINTEMFKIGTRTKVETPESGVVDLQVNIGKLMVLCLNIVAWSFVGKDEKPLPITIEQVGKIDPQYANKILKEIDKRNPF